MITWNELAEAIAKMTPDVRAKPVLTQDLDSGDFIGFDGVSEGDEDSGHVILHASIEAFDPWSGE